MMSVLSLYFCGASEAICFEGLMRMTNDFFLYPLNDFFFFVPVKNIRQSSLVHVSNSEEQASDKDVSLFYVIYFCDSTQERFPPLIIYLHCKIAHR